MKRFLDFSGFRGEGCLRIAPMYFRGLRGVKRCMLCNNVRWFCLCRQILSRLYSLDIVRDVVGSGLL